MGAGGAARPFPRPFRFQARGQGRGHCRPSVYRPALLQDERLPAQGEQEVRGAGAPQGQLLHQPDLRLQFPPAQVLRDQHHSPWPQGVSRDEWRLKFSESIFLRTQKERIIPYIITMFFYWWMHYLSRNFADQPLVLQFFYTGIFMATSVGLIANNFYKISLHGIGMGGASMAVVLFAFYYHQPLGIPITGVLLLTGIVASSRLYISDHSQKEVYMGLLVGALCQATAYFFVM